MFPNEQRPQIVKLFIKQIDADELPNFNEKEFYSIN